MDLVRQILCARYDPRNALEEPANLSDFFEVLNVAGQHGVAASLAQGLRNARSGEQWSRLQPLLDDVEDRNTARNHKFRSAAVSLSQRLADHGIACVFLKGAAFVLECKDSAAWRSLTDLDVLVGPVHLERAAAVLRAEGYRAATDPSGYESRYHHHAAPLYDPNDGLMIELHERLMRIPQDNAVSTEEIFARAQCVWVEGQSVLIPCSAHRMIHLIAHAQISNWGHALRHVQFKDLVDTAELEAGHDIDWQMVRGAFARIGAEPAFLGFVWSAHRLLGVPLPFPVPTFRGVETWTQDAERALTLPASAWRMTSRILRQYLRTFVRHPVRLGIIWTTLTQPERLRRLRRVSRHRLGRAAYPPSGSTVEGHIPRSRAPS